jgi:hypothetical protein
MFHAQAQTIIDVFAMTAEEPETHGSLHPQQAFN